MDLPEICRVHFSGQTSSRDIIFPVGGGAMNEQNVCAVSWQREFIEE